MEQNNEQKQFRCSGDCLRCHQNQRAYCAAQKGYDNQQLILDMKKSIEEMAGTMDEIRLKIAAIQDNEAHVFNPTNEENSEIRNITTAQEGDGAEE